MFFGGAKSKIQVVPQTVRKEKIAVVAKPKISAPLPSRHTPSTSASNTKSARLVYKKANTGSRVYSAGTRSARIPATPDRLDVPSKRKAQRQKSPGAHKTDWGDDSDEEEEEEDGATSRSDGSSVKRVKLEQWASVDLKRKLRNKSAYSEGSGEFPMVHAADVESPIKKGRKGKVLDTPVDKVIVELKYPSGSQRERYDLVDGKDKINSIDEINNIAKIVVEVYLTEEQKKPFTEPHTGILRQIQKAMNMLTKDKNNRQDTTYLNAFKTAVDTYNNAIEGLLRDGRLAKNLDTRHHLPFDMVKLMLLQVYERAVSPMVDQLRMYENGTDNVYGELKPPFVSMIFKKIDLKSDHVFVDLGSGVGNVVLQAALEIGCTSFGCEMMKNPCLAAEKQKMEFEARCRLWGVRPGKVLLEEGDFMDNENIKIGIRTADVILINNQAFTPQLNDKLIGLLLLDCKDGCQVVSLRPLVSPDWQITIDKQNDPRGPWRSVEDSYYSNSVSWTDAGGKYYRMTKDLKRLRQYHRQFEAEEKLERESKEK